MSELFGNVIYAYTRAQAIEDGVLVDVTSRAKEAGFRFNTCLTDAAYSRIVPAPSVASKFGCDVEGRLWDVLTMAGNAMRTSRGGDTVFFEVILPQTARQSNHHLEKFKVIIGPGDDPTPVLTILLPDED